MGGTIRYFSANPRLDGDLNARIHDREGLRGTLGLQFADDYEGFGLVFHPSLEVGAVRQFLDTQSTLDIAFGGASSFRTYGVQRNRTSFRTNAALGISLGANATLSIGYGGELANDRSQHEINVGARVMW